MIRRRLHLTCNSVNLFLETLLELRLVLVLQ